MNTNDFALTILFGIKKFLAWIGIPSHMLDKMDELLFLIVIVIIAFIVAGIVHAVLVHLAKKILKRKRVGFFESMFKYGVFRKLTAIIPPLMVSALLPFAFSKDSAWFILSEKITWIYFFIALIISVNAILNTVGDELKKNKQLKNRPMKGFIQIFRVVFYCVVVIVIISILINKSPLNLITGLGAFTAVLMLVFKDTILGLVAGVMISEDDMLRVAACLEEHFPHSMANAVVRAARERNLAHEEMHSQVEYIVAHGISSMVENKKVVIGSAHFIFEDEKCTVPAGEQEKYDALPVEFSHLYLAIGGELAAVICIADPLRPEACDVMKALRALGIQRTVMLTGDSERTAAAIAAEVGVDDYRAEVLPEDKANFVEQERAAGHTVIMLGDGINDSPALSAANVGVAISDGAAIAREIADITIAAENLFELVALRRIAQGLMSRINSNYRFVIGFNGSLIGLGVAGVLAPATSAMMHNLSTLGISLRSMTNLIDSSETTRLLESK